MKYYLLIFVALLLSCSPITPIPDFPTPTSVKCTIGDQQPYVYHPDRLIKQSTCETWTGRIATVRLQKDGDAHIIVDLIPSDQHFLNDGNSHTNTQGKRFGVVEAICVYQVTQADAVEPCSKDKTQIDLGSVRIGSCAKFEGKYVLDSQHYSWAEIHPLGKVTALPQSVCGAMSITVSQDEFTLPED